MKYLPVISLCAACLVPTAQGQLFSDNFTRETDPGPLTPWTTNVTGGGGNWAVTGGVMKGGFNLASSYGWAYVTNTFTNFSVRARIQLPAGAYGGGLGGRLNPETGARYAVWIYPEGSAGGSNVLKLLKFSNYESFTLMQQANLADVGTGFHTVKLEFASASQINVYFDNTPMLSAMDSTPYTSGGVSLEFWTDETVYFFTADDVAVNALPLVADNDIYTAVSGLPLRTAAPGVLGNDGGGLGPLTALLVSSPAHGTLTLTNNGGFTYVATSGYTGGDSFTYRATDGMSTSSVAIVSIIVNPNNAPVASNDAYTMVQDTTLAVAAPGVLGNDTDADGNSLTAGLVSGVVHGTLSLSADGGFTYTPTAGFAGTDSFTYQANDGLALSAEATVSISVVSLVPLYADSFSRTDLSPWVAQSGNWAVTEGALRATSTSAGYGVSCLTNLWTNYSVQATIQFPASAYGGGIDACLNPTTGARYAAWIYPEGSGGGPNTLKLIKFQNWTSFGYGGASSVPMQSVSLASVGTNAHTLKLACAGSRIAMFFDGGLLISVTDAEANPYLSGAIAADFWAPATGYQLSVDDVLVASLANDDTYRMSQDTTLTLPAPGVLANDTEVYGLSLTAALVSGPTNGALNLGTNGGFTYTPGASFIGTSTFAYQAMDGPASLGTALVSIVVTSSVPSNYVFFENFDGVTAPALPAGWTTSATGAQSAWVTRTTLSDTVPNVAYVTDANNVGLSELVSPSITVPVGQGRLSFRNYYQLEGNPPVGLDGGVLEIKIGAGSFTDILAAGGSFVSGGYNATIETPFGNVLAGRQAWSGNSGGFITTMLNLPAAATGQNIQLRWRCGTDNSTANTGWYIDTVAITNCPCACCWNTPPLLPVQANGKVDELATVVITNTATDADLPAQTLAYQLLAPPAGAVIDTNGVITWTPNEAQGPGTYTLTTHVTDNGSPALSAINSFTVVVNEANSAPTLPALPNQTVLELTTLTVTNPAADADLPANTLTYTLPGAPSGAAIDSNGVITWTPTEAQGPGTYTLTTVVTDNGSPALSATNSFQVVVNETNSAPTLPTQANRTVVELATMTVNNAATDADLPANTLTYTLLAAPSGAVIDANGVITWTPTESQGPGTYAFTTWVTDNASPALSDTNTFAVVVNETNSPPSLPAQANRTVVELSALTVNNAASDADLPANTLTYALLGAPSGAVIDANGVITWTPTEAQGPATYTLTTVVTDNGSPALSATNSFTVAVDESNRPPVLLAQANRTVEPLTTLSVTNLATDPDLPANALTYALLVGPTNASLDSNTGVITWTPTEADNRTTNVLTTVVTDFSPGAVNAQRLSATNSFTVVVLSAPVVVLDSAILAGEGSVPTNNAVDPGEVVTVVFGLKNVGTGADTTSLVATLLQTNGVLLPSGPQAYGVLTIGGPAVSMPFSFLADGDCGGTVTPTLQLQDGTGDLGRLSASFTLGQLKNTIILTQNFDSVTVPALPSGWTTAITGAGSNWRTTNTIVDTTPNAAFTADATNIGISDLLSPPINLSNAPGPFLLSFRNNYSLEASSSLPRTAYDGGVLEIQIGTDAFVDITNAGGVFLSGGYNLPVSSEYESPISNRWAWSGTSTGYVTTTVNLPASAAGQTIRLRWRCVADTGGPSGAGWRIDSIGLTGNAPVCSSDIAPLIQAANIADGVVTVAWSAVAGRTYRLQSKDAPTGTNWIDCPPDVQAIGPLATATNAVGSASQRFYRVYLVP